MILVTFTSSGLSALVPKSGPTHCSTYLTGQRHTHTVHSHRTVSFLTSINRKLRRVDNAGRGWCTQGITACRRNQRDRCTWHCWRRQRSGVSWWREDEGRPGQGQDEDVLNELMLAFSQCSLTELLSWLQTEQEDSKFALLTFVNLSALILRLAQVYFSQCSCLYR